MARRRTEKSVPAEGKLIDMKTGKPVARPELPAICERIAFYRARSGMEQKALAEMLGISPNSVNNWERGRNRPDVNLLPEICKILNITLYDLFGMREPGIHYTAQQQIFMESYGRLSPGHRHVVDNLIDTLTNVELAENCPKLTQLHYFERSLAAGIGDPTEFNDEGSPVYVYSSPDVDRADCIFTVNGNSMEPEFRSGQDVLVERIPGGPDLNYGEIGAFIIGNETYIKEYQEDGLHSLNKDYSTMKFDDEESVYLIGRVLGILDKASYAKPEEVERYEAVHPQI